MLVYVRTRSITQSRMSRVCVCCTTAEAPRSQELLHPQKTPSRGHKLRRWDDPGRVDGSHPREAVAPGPDWLICRDLAKPLVSFSPCGPCGGVVSESCSRDATCLSYRTRFTSFPYLYWALLELVISASCAGSTSTVDCPETSCPPTQKTLSRQLSSTRFAMAFSETPCTSRTSPTLHQKCDGRGPSMEAPSGRNAL